MDWKVIGGGFIWVVSNSCYSCYFSTLFVEDSHFDYIICLYMFQLGWFNHQPDIYWPKIPIRNVCFSETRDVIHAIHPSTSWFWGSSLQFGRVFWQKKSWWTLWSTMSQLFFWGSKLVISMPTFNGILADGNYQALKKLSVRHRESTKDREGEK